MLDGVQLGDNLPGVDRVVAGTHHMTIIQKDGTSDSPVLDQDVSVEESLSTEVAFTLRNTVAVSPETPPAEGTFFLTWLPSDALVLVDAVEMPNQAAPESLLYRSALLSPGPHTVTITGSFGFFGTVDIISGQEVEMKSFTEASLLHLTANRNILTKTALGKRFRQAGATGILLAGLTSFVATGVVYFLGKSAADIYDAATTPEAADSARKTVELYGYLLPAFAGAGGVCMIASSSLFASSLGAGKLEEASRQINRQLLNIRKARDLTRPLAGDIK
jgi:hypothetical protein